MDMYENGERRIQGFIILKYNNDFKILLGVFRSEGFAKANYLAFKTFELNGHGGVANCSMYSTIPYDT